MSNADRFADMLPLEASESRALPALKESIRYDSRYTRPRIDLLESIRYLCSEPTKDLAPVTFEPQPLKRLGRDNSRHEVHFGSLGLDDGEVVASMDVAVKDTVMSWALGELAMNELAQERGMFTFNAIGLAIRDEQAEEGQLVHIITEFDGRLEPLDALTWRDMSSCEMAEVLGNAAQAAATFHSNGLFHGDLEFKNFSQLQTGEVVIVDLEHTVAADDVLQLASDSTLYGSEVSTQAARRIERTLRVDLRDMYKSLRKLPQLRGVKEPGKFKIFKKSILEPYSGALHGDYEDVLASAKDVAHSVLKDESR